MLINYVCFHCPSEHHDTNTSTPESGGASIGFFGTKTQKVEISWVMKREKQVAEEQEHSPLRSVHFRGTLNLKLLTMPRNGVEFVSLFLGDIHERWEGLIGSAKLHLSRIVSSLLYHSLQLSLVDSITYFS